MRARATLLCALLLAALSARAAALTPNDQYYANNQWYAPLLNLPTAWDYSLGSPNLTVAILDTGVIASTPDLAPRLLPPLSATPYAPLDGTSHHHGTWVASAVGMSINNNIGGAGVGHFSLLPITVTNASGTNSSDWLAKGIRLAADQGARVINISHSTFNYALLDNAAAYARGKGALTFVAAGNSNSRLSLQGYDNLIFVSGTDPQDQRWDEGSVGSSWGAYVDLSAPAYDILVADPTLPAGYGLASGTSFAAPLAAGAAALAWSINPALGPDEVQSILYQTALDLGTPGWDEVFGHGRINIGAVAAAAHATLPEPSATLTVTLLALFLGRRRRIRK